MKDHKDFKIVFIPSLASHGAVEFTSEHDSLSEAAAVLNAIANYTLLLHETSLMPDYTNTGMIFKNTLDEWIEVGDDGTEI